ncbi:MAG TPA: cytosolic protein [Deltaproteobacteria bacterium]|nr:cytosolic protein [Deltaproteobacteria bacterium]
MKKLNLRDVTRYVEENIGVFHQQRIASIDALKLSQVLKRKNPYLFKAKHMLTAEQIVKGLVDAHISSSEEGIFGDWLEGLAIFINKKVYSGWKSGISGIDLEFDKNNVRYIVTIKSGPNWGNSRQIREMIANFNSARKTLKTSNSKLQVEAVNGCCYGRDRRPYKKANYYKYCGQQFWEFISGNLDLYLEIIEPLGHKAKEKNESFTKSYSKMINKFTREFANGYCKDDGSIDWGKLVHFNSSMAQPKT